MFKWKDQKYAILRTKMLLNRTNESRNTHSDLGLRSHVQRFQFQRLFRKKGTPLAKLDVQESNLGPKYLQLTSTNAGTTSYQDSSYWTST